MIEDRANAFHIDPCAIHFPRLRVHQAHQAPSLPRNLEIAAESASFAKEGLSSTLFGSPALRARAAAGATLPVGRMTERLFMLGVIAAEALMRTS